MSLHFRNLTITSENSKNSESELAFESGYKHYQTLTFTGAE